MNAYWEMYFLDLVSEPPRHRHVKQTISSILPQTPTRVDQHPQSDSLRDVDPSSHVSPPGVVEDQLPVDDAYVKFISCQLGSFPRCTVVHDAAQKVIRLSGTSIETRARKATIQKLLADIHEDVVELDPFQTDLLRRDRGKMFLDAFWTERGFDWRWRGSELILVNAKDCAQLRHFIFRLEFSNQLGGQAMINIGAVVPDLIGEKMLKHSEDLLVRCSLRDECIYVEGIAVDVEFAKSQIMEDLKFVERELPAADERVQFVVKELGMFPFCSVIHDPIRKLIVLRGIQIEVQARHAQIISVLGNIQEEIIELESFQMSFLLRERGKMFLNAFWSEEGFVWVLTDTKLVILSSVKSKTELHESVEEFSVELNGRATVHIDAVGADISDDLVQVQIMKLSVELLVSCSHNGKCVVIEGVKCDVEHAECEMRTFLWNFSLIEDIITINGEKALLIKSHLMDEFEQLLSGIKFQMIDTSSDDKLTVHITCPRNKLQYVKHKIDSFVKLLSRQYCIYTCEQRHLWFIRKGSKLCASVRDMIELFEKENKCLTDTQFLDGAEDVYTNQKGECMNKISVISKTDPDEFLPAKLRDQIHREIQRRLKEFADARKEKGNNFFKEKNYSEALACYTEAISFFPNSASSASFFGNRAAAYIKLDKYKEGLADAKRAILLDSDYTRGYLREGECYMGFGNIEAALCSYRRAQQIEPNNGVVQHELEHVSRVQEDSTKAESCLKMSDYKSAMIYLDLCTEYCPQALHFKSQKAECLALTGRYEECEALVADILEIDQLNADALYARALCLYGQDNLDVALENLRDVLHKTPDHENAKNLYWKAKKLASKRKEGSFAFNAGNFHQAYDLYTEALSIDPRNKSVNSRLYCNRATVCSKIGQVSEAIQDCTKALELDAGYIKAYLRRAKCYTEQELHEDAVQDYERVCEIDKTKENEKLLHDARLKLASGRVKILELKKEEGNAAFRAGKYKLAYDLYTEALDIDPDNKSVNSVLFCNRAIVCSKLGQFYKAIDDCTKSIELQDFYSKAYFSRAKYYMEVELYEEAVKDYEKIYNRDRNLENKKLLNHAKSMFEKSKKKTKDYHDILGVPKNASSEEIKKAYHQKAKIHHPDRHRNEPLVKQKIEERRFKDINEAHKVLSERAKKGNR